MTAGSGIVALSNALTPEERAKLRGCMGSRHGLRLPRDREEVLPELSSPLPGVSAENRTDRGRALRDRGEAYGARSPVETLSPLFYVDA